MAVKASSKLRPKVITLQKRAINEILKRVEIAAASGTLTDKTVREAYRAKVRVRTGRAAKSDS